MSLIEFKNKYKPSNFSYALLSRTFIHEGRLDENAEMGVALNGSGKYEIELEHNLDEYFHPASLLKLFIGFICEEKLKALNTSSQNSESEKLITEVKRAIKASIKDSDNDALAYLIDFLTAQPYDYNFIPAEDALKKLSTERCKINEFFRTQGFSHNLNIANKCFSFDYYGKEKQVIELIGANQVTNRDLIKLLIKIKTESDLVLNSMHRAVKAQKAISENQADDEKAEITAPQHVQNISSSIIDTNEYQVEAFSPRILADALKIEELFSKAGWNSRVRHDTLIFKFRDKDFILSILTKNLSQDESILQDLVVSIIKESSSLNSTDS